MENYSEVIDVQDLFETRSMILASDEKQIFVDPISLRDHSNPNKFLSNSLPNSASSSPNYKFLGLKNKPKNLTHASSLPVHVHPLYRQQSIALTNLERLKQIHLSRSKSCGDGRASVPSEDLEFWSRKNSKLTKHGHRYRYRDDDSSHNSSGGEGEDRIHDINCEDKDFKCGALCLFLPGFGKQKPEKTKMYQPATAGANGPESGHFVVSKRFSLEKFECGSWRSSAIMDDEKLEEGGGIKDIASNLFYDLPIEMIRSRSINKDDTHSPVTSAFVFDKDPKGAIKKSSSTATLLKMSSNVSRRVRFSTSSSGSPTNSVTPRIHKVGEEFKAYLEAQI